MDIVAELERLQQRREALSREMTGIDAQLTRVREALGFGTRTLEQNKANGNRYTKPRYSQHGGEATRKAVLAALAAQEPLSAEQLKDRTHVTTASVTAAAMAYDGTIVRQKALSHGRRLFLYARTAEAFNGHPDVVPSTDAPASDATPEEAGDDEMG